MQQNPIVLQQKTAFDLSQDVYVEKGGSCTDIMAGGVGECLYGACCSPCQLSQALETAGEGSCAWNLCLTLGFCCGCQPCTYYMLGQSMDNMAVKMGGNPQDKKTIENCALLCFCTPCVSCQASRAATKCVQDGTFARTSGMMMAPHQQSEMKR